VADDSKREMRLGDDEMQRRPRSMTGLVPADGAVGPRVPPATPVHIASPSARGVFPNLERRTAAYEAEVRQFASNPDTPEPTEIGQPSDTFPGLRRVSPQATRPTVDNEDEITRLQILGCDTPIRRGVLRTLNTIGSIVVPHPIAYILGTEALWQMYNPQSSKG
jgi:hypothetical protein